MTSIGGDGGLQLLVMAMVVGFARLVAPEEYHTQGTIPQYIHTPHATTTTTAATPPAKQLEQLELVAHGGWWSSWLW